MKASGGIRRPSGWVSISQLEGSWEKVPAALKRYRPAIPQSLHALNMLTLERPSTYLLGNRCFANFWIAPGRFRADGLNNSGSLLPDFREFGQIARFRLQQGLQTQKPAVYQHIGL